MTGYKFLLLITMAILLSLVVVIWFYPPSNDYGDNNPFWNGLKGFYSEFEASSIDSFDSLPDTPELTVLVLIPCLDFTESELEKLEEYTSQGGTLIILDDYGYGNKILDYFGLDSRFNQYPLLDPLCNFQNEWYPEITKFATTSITEDIDSILLNHAVGLSGGSEADIIAWSSEFSFLDLNSNSSWDEGEPEGPIPVAAALQVDDGYLILVADPSILINSMKNKNDNHEFISNIIQIQYTYPEVFVDQSHFPAVSLDEAKKWISIVRDWLSYPLVVSGIVMVSLIITLRSLRTEKIKD